MRTDPFTDTWLFLIGQQSDEVALGWGRWLVAAGFALLVLASIVIAIREWIEDPAQRTGRDVTLWALRALIGGMWFQGMLWKLPFGNQNGLYYWTQQMAGRAAFPQLGQFVSDVILPNFGLFNPLVFLAEFGFATAFILGLFVRIAGLGSMVMCLTLWLGIYNQRPGDPAEWSWSYVFLAMLGGTFAVLAAGRALGADAWIRRNVASVRDRRPAGMLLRALT